MKELNHRRKARKSILDFTTYTFPEYQVAWHHRLIASYIDMWVARDIKRLMIFSPPRSGKSELVSRRLPPFLFGLDPTEHIIASSHTLGLAQEMASDVKTTMATPEYARLFPGTRLPGRGEGINYAGRFDVLGGERKGIYKAGGVGTGITGMGATRGIIDDVTKDAMEAASPTTQEKHWRWYGSTYKTRGEARIDEYGNVLEPTILVMMTRWNRADLAGKLLELQVMDEDAEQWTVLSLPSIADKGAALHPEDPRPYGSGEALWPERYPLKTLAEFRSVLGASAFQALYQQSPTLDGGNLFREEWFNRYGYGDEVWHVRGGRVYKNQCTIYMTVDPAATATKGSDFTAIGVFALTPANDLLVLEIYADRLEIPEIVPQMLRLSKKWGSQFCVFEANGFQSAVGREAIRTREMCAIDMVKVSINKGLRAEPAVIRCQAGQIFLPQVEMWPDRSEVAWVKPFLDQLTVFTGMNDPHDDMVDVLSAAVLKQQDMGRILPPGPVEVRAKELESAGYALPRGALFGGGVKPY